MRPKVKPNVQARADQTTFDLFGEVGLFPNTALYFSERIGQLSPTAPILVRINSLGGNYSEGQAIYSVLRHHEGPVTTHVISVAASAATIVFLAGAERIIDLGAAVMIHEASSAFHGTAAELRDQADLLTQFNESMSAVYAERTGQTPKKIAEMVSEQTWMNSEEAIALNFATKLSDSKAVAATGDLSKAPDRIRTQLLIPPDTYMDVKSRLGLKPEATDEELDAALTALLARPIPDAPSAPTTQAQAPGTDLKDLVASAVAEALAARDAVAAVLAVPAITAEEMHGTACASAVERFITEGKIPPANRAAAIKACGGNSTTLKYAVELWEKQPRIVAQPQKMPGHVQGTPMLSSVQSIVAKAAGMTDQEFVDQQNKLKARH